MQSYLHRIVAVLFISAVVIFSSCTERYDAASENYESLLVVEATITDSLQQHTVLLSRTNAVNTFDRNVETNAEVWVESSIGEVYQFSETEEGTYVSNMEFAAQQGNAYRLHITTGDGKEYVSTEEETPQKPIVTNVYAQSEMNDFGVEGVNVSADVVGTSDVPLFVKYEYEEQHKIVTLFDIPYEYDLLNLVIDTDYDDGTCETDFDLVVTDRTVNSSICYSFPTRSNVIIQKSSASFSGNEISGTDLTFIPSDEYKLRERCSILVQAFSQNYESYQYYNNLDKMNQSESELSSQQPGYLRGNMNSLEDNEERIFGYFNVWSLGQKRIFFDYTDFGFSEPDYFAEIDMIFLTLGQTPCPGPTGNDSLVAVHQIEYQLVGIVPGSLTTPPEYIFINPACGDCRSRGYNVMPSYWEEE